MRSRYSLAFAAAILLMPIARAADNTADLDLSDCRVLFGQARQKDFSATLASQRRKAESGDMPARKLLAAVANNRFACDLDDLDEGAGWSVTSTPDGNAGGSQASVTSTRVVDAATIMKTPAAHESLRQAFAAAQSLADEDIAFRNMAAVFVADYGDALPGKNAVAYRDAVGVREVACRHPETVRGNAARTFCLSARSVIASLYEKLSPAERPLLEAEGGRWAARYVRSLEQ